MEQPVLNGRGVRRTSGTGGVGAVMEKEAGSLDGLRQAQVGVPSPFLSL